MNESEYITDMETTEEHLSEDSVESDTPSVTQVNDTGTDSVSSVSDVTEISETTCTSVSDYDHLARIEDNTSGILLMTTAIFFSIVIAFIAKMFGGYLSL